MLRSARRGVKIDTRWHGLGTVTRRGHARATRSARQESTTKRQRFGCHTKYQASAALGSQSRARHGIAAASAAVSGRQRARVDK